ncbi:MAG: META domain-containing protein, partial [Chitinophagaceae bacterium]|nr:META domain-containing protein [Chitinophagaceae bacterium]
CILAAFSCNNETKPTAPGADSTKVDTTAAATPAAAPATTQLGTTDSTGLKERYWKLIELNGKPVKADSTFMKEPHVIFKQEKNEVHGNGGCNGFGGEYELKSPNRIKIERLVSTQMACPALDIENRFTKVLTTADNYYVNGDTLILNKARMAPLARFVAVVMK